MMNSVLKVQEPVITLRHDADLLMAVAEILKHYRLAGEYHSLSLVWSNSISAWRLILSMYQGDSFSFLIRYETDDDE